MAEGRRLTFALYVDRCSQQWIVLDPDGQFWTVPAAEEEPWVQRQSFVPTDETELEPVPGHYKHMLGLPAFSSEGFTSMRNKIDSIKHAPKRRRGKSGDPI